jgi:hypothetical protein
MRICLVATGDAPSNPRLMTLSDTLSRAGHNVSIVCGGRSRPTDPEGIVRVPSRVPEGRGRLGRVLRRLQPKTIRRRSFTRRLISTTADLDPDLIYATTAGVIPIAREAARRSGAVIVRDPRFPDAGDRDIIHLAPTQVRFSSSPAGPGLPFQTPRDERTPWYPEADRHSGTKAVMAYQATETTPARYLRAALERAGIEVRHVGDRLNWEAIDRDVGFVVFVESPYPGIEVVGDNPGIPVLLWAHHGEHHTGTHLRLIRRYGVHAVLLAHSWHLAHRYPVPVHRFPFAVAPEVFNGAEPWDERSLDTAFVGSLGSESGTYDARRRLLDSLSEALPDDRVCFTDSASPAEMARIYARSKTVVDDGGTRHFPITMRVFETIGSGALLLTTDAPGLSCLFSRDREYLVLDVGHPGEQVRRITGGGSSGARTASAAHEYATGRHLYDHRVDELVEIAAATVPSVSPDWERPDDLSPLARAIDDHLEIETVAAYGATGLRNELPLQSVWLDPDPGTRSYDAVVIGANCVGEVGPAVDDAVRYAIVDDDSGHCEAVERQLRAKIGPMFVKRGGGVTVFDLGTPGYRVIPAIQER